jgi:hypothetical protein
VVPVIGEASAMIRAIGIVLIAAALSACSADVWRRSGATEQDVRIDTVACQNAARRSSESSGLIYAQLTSYNYFNNCMAARGYLVSLY